MSKLGYGGTEGEMEKLLADAEALSGVHYDIKNLGDVYDAIHVIQEDLGLTGVAAYEAGETFTGSFASMKAAASNFFGSLALGEGVEEATTVLLGNAKAFIFNNLLPMIDTVKSNIPTALKTAFETAIPMIQETFPTLLQNGIDAIKNIASGITEALPGAVETFTGLFTTFQTTITEQAPGLIENARTMFTGVVETVTELLPTVIDKGTEFVHGFIEGATTIIPELLTQAETMLDNVLTVVGDAIPGIVDSARNLFLSFIDGFVENFPTLTENMGEHLKNVTSIIIDHAPEFLSGAINLILAMIEGIAKATPAFLRGIGNLLKGVGEAILETDWGEFGSNIIDGIKEGLLAAGDALWEALLDICDMALGVVKDFFGIKSPSRVMRDQVGKFLPSGVALGVEDNSKVLDSSMETMVTGGISKAKEALDNAGTIGARFRANNDGDGVAQRLDQLIALFPTIADAIGGMGVTIDGGALVGQITNDIDRSLGRIATQKGRYVR